MSAFFIEPAESLMFGQPRSFSAGEAHRSHSLFPPSPLAFQGLVRTRLLYGAQPAIDFEIASVRKEIAALVGTPDRLPNGWQMTGPYPARRRREDGKAWVEPWVPAPRFLLLAENDQVLPVRPMVPAHPSLSDLGEQPLLLGRPEAGPCEPLSGWLSPHALKQALTMPNPEASLQWKDSQWTGEALPPFVQQEFQPGLAIELEGATAAHGLLYFLEALRFESDSGLLGGLAGPLADRLDAGALRQGAGHFGRKGRLVSFDEVERLDPDWEDIMAGRHLQKADLDKACFWLVALTPLRLDKSLGLQPRETLPGGVRLETLAALTGPPLALGGFSLAEGKARPNRSYFPAGSAWAVRLAGGDPETRAVALRAINNRHPFGPAEEAAMGFGHIVVGLAPSFIGEKP